MQTGINSRYRVIEELGRGGFGHTFLAEDTHLPSRRLCVIKKLLPPTTDPHLIPIIQQRFEREAAILEELGESHEQIPNLYAYFVEGEQFFLVQQLIEGDTLGQRIRTGGPLPEAMVKEIMLDLLPVLEFVHSKEIIHRDIKPDNIILRKRDGKPVLIDFGAVKETVTTVVDRNGNPSSVIFGSPGFMSLEQAAGMAAYSSDLFSLGWTAIYLLTGKLPLTFFDKRTGESVWRPDVPALTSEFAEVIEKAVQPHVRDRFRSAAEMMASLRRDTPLVPTLAARALAPTVAARADSEETLAVEERTLQRSVLPPTVASASPDVTTAAAGKRLTAASDLLPDGADILVPSTTKPFIEPNRRRKIFVINTCLIAGLTTGGSLIVAGPLFVDHASDFFPLLILWLFDFLWWGLLLGLGQAALLRRSISPAAWILSTLLGTAVARITNTVLVGSLLGLSGGSVAFIFAYTLGPGLLRNLPQWLVLRRRVKNAWLWPTFSLCVAVIFAALGGGFPHYRYEIIEYAIARVLPLALVIGLLQSLCLSLFTLKDGQDYYATGEPRDLSRLSRRDKVLSIAIVVALVMLLAGFAGMLLQEEYEFILMIQFGGLIGLPAALIGSIANVLIKNGPLRWFLPAVVGGMFVVILGIISNSDASAYLPISIALGGFSVLSVALSNAVLSVLETVRSPSQTDLATQQL